MLEISSAVVIVAGAGLFIGTLLGITMIHTRFCTMGAVADIALSRNYGRMRSWILAIVVAIVGTQLAVAFGLLHLDETLYLQSSVSWLGAVLGGVMFGFGMVIACGCGARSLVMIGSGDLRALVSMVVLGIVAYMTIRGIFAMPRSWLYSATTIDFSRWLATPNLNAALSRALDLADRPSRIVAIAIIGIPALWFVFKDREFRHSSKRIAAGLLVGSLVITSWLATGWAIDDEFEEVPVVSLTFVAPVGDSLQYLMIWTGASITFGVTVVGGVILGGWLACTHRKEFYLRGFEDVAEMVRYMGGGALMGMGGALAGGCTFGQGISGVSTLGFMSFLALASIVLGAFVGIRYLEQDSLSAALRAMWQRADTR